MSGDLNLIIKCSNCLLKLDKSHYLTKKLSKRYYELHYVLPIQSLMRYVIYSNHYYYFYYYYFRNLVLVSKFKWPKKRTKAEIEKNDICDFINLFFDSET